MNHLTHEQFENILQGKSLDDEHLSQCKLCQSRLKEKQALAARLKIAFSGVTPSDELSQKIHNQIGITVHSQDQQAEPQTINLPPHWKRWATTVSSIAAILILGLLVKVTLIPDPAYADLVEIHQHNLRQGNDYVPQTDPDALVTHFQEALGFNPRLPAMSQGVQLRGCCIKHFKDKVVGSYVVGTPQGIISIVAVQDEPVALNMKRRSQTNSHTYYHSQFAKCDMVAVRISGYTYCAIGEVTPDYLQTLLEKLIP